MSENASSPPPAVAMRGIVKRFPNVQANDGADFILENGEIHSLLGENGAGKTTLMRILSGFYRPDAGRIVIDGRPTAFHLNGRGRVMPSGRETP